MANQDSCLVINLDKEVRVIETNTQAVSVKCKNSQGKKLIKVLIADDHAIVRAGLKQVLSESLDIVVVGEAVDGHEALNKMREQDWDVMLLDMTMPGKSGLEVLKQIKSERPKLAVLILSIYDEDNYALRALKAGAAGYLTKGCIPEQLIEAVRKAAVGGKYITPQLAERLAFALDPNVEEAPHDVLSNRELQIFELLASGEKMSEIARELSVSTKTVSAHRANILQKMNMKSNSELMFYAIENKLVSKKS